ncbi:MAG: hypothetical protein FJX67_12740 [Alphaproteobacteria bacterium]|nr:hypothetical protein [Alphaproteobacteria bacterium]
MPESQERQIAEREHPKILEQFGGEYNNSPLAQYVGSIVNFLGRTSDRPALQYRVTILNSPVVNAFALPAGYLYLTRGLLALADNEAEIAGVLGHEIGHVTARHTAQRYSRGVLAQGVVGIVGVLAGDGLMGGLAKLAEPAAMIAFQSFSREQEFEADLIGVKTMSRAGFDPTAMASFLESLGAHTELEARMAGKRAEDRSIFDLFATHPRTADRVKRAIEASQSYRVAQPTVARETYLQKINGMLYGDDPEQGVIRGQAFIHPKLDVRFEAPAGFKIVNGASQVSARNQQGAVLRFDMGRADARMAMDRYVADIWAQGRQIAGLQAITVNGFPAATASTTIASENRQITVWLMAIDGPGELLYRFMFMAPAEIAAQQMPQFHHTMQSFRTLTNEERRFATGALKLSVVQARSGDTTQSLAGRMATAEQFRLDQFSMLNGFAPNRPIRAGSLFKLIVN